MTQPPHAHLYWHATLQVNIAGVLTDGLLTTPPTRNFATGAKIYLALTRQDALRWAAEIARQHGCPVPMALLTANMAGQLVIRSDNTVIGVPQAVTITPVPPEVLELAELFEATPMPLPGAVGPGVPEGVFVCRDCGFEYVSHEALACHRGECEYDWGP